MSEEKLFRERDSVDDLRRLDKAVETVYALSVAGEAKPTKRGLPARFWKLVK